MRVFVTGGTGLIGARLVRALWRRGDEVVVLSRRADAWKRCGSDCAFVRGDPGQPGPWAGALAGCDAVVHLAGENIFARRWTPAFKQVLRDSRVRSTEQLVAALAKVPPEGGRPAVLVSGSAVGYYGPRGDEELGEDAPPGDDFLARVCLDWERAAVQAEAAGLRVVLLRTGLVLDGAGGLLPQLLTPFKLFVGGPAGPGTQWMSWVHHADLTGLLLTALDRPAARGPLNGTAPHPVTNRDFSATLGKVLGRPSAVRVPALALRLRFGQVAEVITTGQRVLPRRALALGYQFQFPELEGALRDVLGGNDPV
jgi:uncharacterized protein